MTATIVGLAALITYVLIIVRQSTSHDISDPGLVAGVMVLLLGLAVLTGVGATASRRRVSRASLAAAAIGWFVLGYIALWSVGILLILAGLLAVLELARDRDARP